MTGEVTNSFVVSESIPTWAKNLGAKEIRNARSGRLEKILIPSGVGDRVLSAVPGDTVAIIGDKLVVVIPAGIVEQYKA